VVLLPLAVLGSIVIAVWPKARERYGWLVVGVTAVATILVPVATNSGGKLKARIAATGNAAVNRHEQLGNLMIYFAVPLLVFVTALMVVHQWGDRLVANWTKLATIIAAVLTIGFAVAAGVHVYRVGEAGSRAVWDGTQNLPTR
jgi:uncharacterized membrane protein YhaH (DUF805 family)